MFKFLKTVSPVLLTSCVLTVLVGFSAHITNKLLSTPEAVFSNTDDKCVFVVVAGEYRTCDPMPKVYTKRWIK